MGRRAKALNNSFMEMSAVTALSEIPDCPNYYNDDRKEIWNTTCKALMESGRLVIQILTSVEGHVEAVMLLRRVANDKKAKATTVASAIEGLRKTAVDLGLTLGSFARAPILKHKANNVGMKSDVLNELESRIS